MTSFIFERVGTLLLKGGTLRIWSYMYNKGHLQLKEAMKLLILVIKLAFLSQPDYTSLGANHSLLNLCVTLLGH